MFQCVHYFVDQHQKNRIWNVLWRTKLLLTLYLCSERRTFPACCCSDVDSCYFVCGCFFTDISKKCSRQSSVIGCSASITTLMSHTPVQPCPGPSERAPSPPPAESTDWESCSGWTLSPLWRVWVDGPPSPGPAAAPPRPAAPPPGPAGCGPASGAAGARCCGGACYWWSQGLDCQRGKMWSGRIYEPVESRG